MLVELFYRLKAGGLPVSITEFLALLDGLKHHVSGTSVDDFYFLSRTALVKDERLYDRYDQVFGDWMNGIEQATGDMFADIPEDWLRRQAELNLSEEDRAAIEAMGGFDKLMETLRQRLEEQKDRHEGGNKWVGTAGTSPFGAFGYNPEGVRIGQGQSRHRSAVKVWEKRDYRNLDGSVELGTRNIKLALRKLRQFAREGAADQLDLDDTIRSTARNAGWLDLRMVPERHNAVKVLLLLDIGGSMDDHVRLCEELFSAVRSEFKHLEHYYFHNFIYESVWKDNRRRFAERTPTLELIRTFGRDYKLIFVGDATMSPYEIVYPGGSVEHWNEEAGAVWIGRLLEHFRHSIWLNPEPERRWPHTPSIRIARELMGERMFPLTLNGLDEGIKALKRKAP